MSSPVGSHTYVVCGKAARTCSYSPFGSVAPRRIDSTALKVSLEIMFLSLLGVAGCYVIANVRFNLYGSEICLVNWGDTRRCLTYFVKSKVGSYTIHV